MTKFGITLGDWDRQNILHDPIVKAFYDQIENESCVREWLSKRDDYPSWYALQIGYGGAFDGPIARVQISTIAKYRGRVAAAIVYGCPENSGFFSKPEQMK